MSDEIENSIHDKLVLAFIEYATANEKFEIHGFIVSAVEARAALNTMYELIKLRRKEIQKTRVAMHGDVRKGIKPVAPSPRRQRKLDRQIQKQQAQTDDNTN
jgi:hypothetical protein